uniref:Uncharacterized protein n=2 Tax=Culex quinquefasciatus TaxID=7176 RepID=A0A1S4JSZ5_CULQU
MEIDLFHLAAVITIFALVYRHLTKNNDYFHDKPIPSLAVKPGIGSTGSLMFKLCSFSDYIKSIYDKFPSVKVFGLFDTTMPFFVIRDPELIKQIAVKDFDHFVDHRTIMGNDDSGDSPRLFGNSLFSMNGQRWRDMRATLSPAFTGSKMRQMFQLMVDCCETMVRYYDRDVGNHGGSMEIEVKDMLSRVGIDVIASCAFGLKVDSFKEQENEFLKQGRKMVNFGRIGLVFKMMAIRMFPKLLGGLGIDIIDKDQTEYFTKLIKDTVKARESQGVVRNDMIDLLLQAKKGELKHHQEKEEQEGFATVQESDLGKGSVVKPMTENEMIAQCFIFFIAGFDSVSTSVMFAIYELVRNPEVQDKLCVEVLNTRKSLNGKPLTYDALQKMEYLDMVISETLRMWAPAPAIDRLCVRDYELDDGEGLKFTIEKGTCVWFPVHGIHLDPKYFPEPEKFDPERFSDENKQNIVSGTYLPFGVGPRNCIGSRFALMEVKAILYHMLLKFSFVKNENTQIPLVLRKGFTNMGTEKPIYVQLVKRN